MNLLRTLTAKNLNNRHSAKIRGIVLHDTAGSGTIGDAKYLANDPENRKVSVDFVVLKTGEIYQLNPDLEKNYTNHAGRSTLWKVKNISGVQINKGTVGIEISQKAHIEDVPDPKYPPEQVQAVAELCSHLCQQLNLTKMDITTHKDLITDGSRSDPRKFPWDIFWDEFNIAASANTLEPTVNTSVLYHTVAPGDTLWSLAVKYSTKVEVIKSLNHLNTMSNNILVGQKLIVKE